MTTTAMKRKTNTLRMQGEMSGVQLEQVTCKSWRLTGVRTVDLERRDDERTLQCRWHVMDNGIDKGGWTNCGLALAHAFALAGGHDVTAQKV